MNKEAKARERARRIRSMMRNGMTEDQIKEYFSKQDARFVLCLLYGDFTVEDGKKKKTVVKRDEKHKIVSKEEVEIPNILHGVAAAKKFAEQEKMEIIASGVTSIWVKTDKSNVDEIVKKLSPLGRTSVTKPETKTEKKEKIKKPTNNTAEAKKKAKAKRKAENIAKTDMRPYYAALRKGGVSKRIKKYNKTLADKIEKWLKEKKNAKPKGRLTRCEIKQLRRERKAIRKIEEKKRRIAAEWAKHEAKVKAKKKAPVQTELKMAA